ncbi:UNVERIFIED_CONTAM: Sperm flagellar protein 1 [Siphonaria sp. JEL0065]|nr:Sperm flagellar protein 1 [Siphonaria sp. JEL0065]
MNITLSEEDIASLLAWIDEIPISKPKKNITRDFSDGGDPDEYDFNQDLNPRHSVATAEVIHHFCPKLVELFMYSPANAVSQKMYNWNTLNQKVFRKLGYLAQPELISCIVANKPGYVEYLLFELRHKIDAYLSGRRQNPSIASNDDHHQQHLFAENNLHGQYLPTLPNTSYYQGQNQPTIPGAAEGAYGAYGGSGTEVAGGGRRVGNGHMGAGGGQEKDFMIKELQETIQILQLKITKLEQLLILKDRRIDELVGSGLAGLSTGYLLTKNNQLDKEGRLVNFEVHLFEKAAVAGMDSGSISVPCECAECVPSNRPPRELEHVDVRMDVPLRAIFPDYYPLVSALYDAIGIPYEASDHSMSVWKSPKQPINPATHLHSGNTHQSPDTTNTSNSYLSFSTYKLPKPIDSHLFLPDLPSLWLLVFNPFVFLNRVWCLVLMVLDYWRMYAAALYVRRNGELEKARRDGVKAKGIGAMTLGDFFRQYKYSDEFVTGGFLPMFSVLCTCTFEETLEFPAVLVLDHFATMGLVGKMSFVTCGVKTVCSVLSEPIHQIAGSTIVTRIEKVGTKFNVFTAKATATSTTPDAAETQYSKQFDHIIFATQANQCNRVIESSRSGFNNQDSEWLNNATSVLKRFVYTKSVVVCHTDKSLMPEGAESSWKCLNFVYPPTVPNHMTRGLRNEEDIKLKPFNFKDTAQCTHYIQRSKPNLPDSMPPLFSTTNPIMSIRSEDVLSVSWYERAIVTVDSMRAVKDLRSVQGGAGVWFVGSFAGEGVPLLEGCLESAVDVVQWIAQREGVEARFPGNRLDEIAKSRMK